jgi:putative DNA methylase
MKVYIPKKLIDVALPLDAINTASAKEKAIRKGHPSTLHMWWARRPMLSARAIIFAQLVNDPGGLRGWMPNKSKAQCDQEREELFDIIKELCQWSRNNDVSLMSRAVEKIRESWVETCRLNPDLKLDPNEQLKFLDPFSGGATLPIEADRLGLKTYASDLNPIPVLIAKSALTIPKKMSDYSGISQEKNSQKSHFEANSHERLADDVEFYGHKLLHQTRSHLEQIYPRISTGNSEEIVIAWIWARTVKSPNPAFNDCDVPLVKSFRLASKNGGRWLKPIVDSARKTWEFEIVSETNKPDQDGLVGRKGATCIFSGTNIPLKYIREEGVAGRIGHKLIAIVTKAPKGRRYLPANKEQEEIAKAVSVNEYPSAEIDHWPGCTNSVVYGMDRFEKLFTNRQLKTLVTLSDGIKFIHRVIKEDFLSKHTGLLPEAEEYAKSVCLYIAFAISKTANRANSVSSWMPSVECPGHLFSKHAIPMTWDYCETNILWGPSGSFESMLGTTADGLRKAFTGSETESMVARDDAGVLKDIDNVIISTDPPYYDNIPYSNLSDFFYIWLRRSLREFYPETMSTIVSPKAEELVANKFRAGGSLESEQFFLEGMKRVFRRFTEISNKFYPTTIYYAFKQAETVGGSTYSKGWETFIEAILVSGLMITGTWPLRTERENRSRNQGANALASSILLVCYPRPDEKKQTTRRDFQRELREKMPVALEVMVGGGGVNPISPVDLAQSAIGPGMAIFSKYEVVLNQDGSKMTVHDALILINRTITEFLNPDSGNFDNDTLFCDDWFSQYGWSAGQFGEADTLARAKGTSVDGVEDAGVVESGGGKVRLLKWKEYPNDWDPKSDNRTPVWEACHHMIRVLSDEGESAAGAMLARMPERGEAIRQLAYHLYTVCERKKWADDARAYNELIGSWRAIVSASHDTGIKDEQAGFDF